MVARRIPPSPLGSQPQSAARRRSLCETHWRIPPAAHDRRAHAPRARPEFEELMKELKEAAEKNPDTAPVFVSQVIEGGTDAIFYVSTLRSSMAGFDHNPTAKEILGEDGFKKFQQANAEVIETTDSTLYRFNPELSNAPDEVAKVAIDFWRPKSAAKPKSTPPAASATPKGATKKQ